MKHQFRRILAGLAIVAGVFLIVVEVLGLVRGDGLQGIFWLLVAVLLVALGAAEFLPFGKPDQDRRRSSDDDLPL